MQLLPPGRLLRPWIVTWPFTPSYVNYNSWTWKRVLAHGHTGTLAGQDEQTYARERRLPRGREYAVPFHQNED
jgi:hypothetical protein